MDCTRGVLKIKEKPKSVSFETSQTWKTMEEIAHKAMHHEIGKLLSPTRFISLASKSDEATNLNSISPRKGGYTIDSRSSR